MKKSKEGRIKSDAIANYKPFKCPNHFSTEQLKNEYRKEGVELTDEEAQNIRNAFDLLHEICYQAWTNSKKETNNLTLIKNEESHIIYPGEYRRAS